MVLLKEFLMPGVNPFLLLQPYLLQYFPECSTIESGNPTELIIKIVLSK